MRKTIELLMTAGFVLSLAACASAAKECRYGYLDVPRILEEYEGFKDANKGLEATREKLEKEAQDKRDALNREGEQIQKNAKLWSETTRQEKEQEYLKKAKEFQEWQVTKSKELQDKQEGLVKRLEADVRRVLEDIGRKGGFSFVVRGDLLLYRNADAQDLTDKVLAALRTQEKK